MQISLKQDSPQPKVGFSDTEAWIRIISLRCKEGQPIWIQVSMPQIPRHPFNPRTTQGVLGKSLGTISHLLRQPL